jgi:catechol 2,3-dioxygenase-like lactoylglutathione lyase family enzyme
MPIGNKNQIITGCGLHHIAIQCRDLEQSLRLYRDVLGMTVTLEFNLSRPIVLVDMGDGSYIELIGPDRSYPVPEMAHSPAHPLMHIALTAADTRAAIEVVRQAGYTVTDEPQEIILGGVAVTNAFFRGPNDELIEFFQVHA